MKRPILQPSPTTLAGLLPGEIAYIDAMDPNAALYGRMTDMGLHPGVYIRCERISLFRDPVAYRILQPLDSLDSLVSEEQGISTVGPFIDETLIALRRRDAQTVHIQPLKLDTEHRGEAPLIAMAGNPNVGKSSLFNALTGLHQHTGNWTGKTVGCTVGLCRTGRRPAAGQEGTTTRGGVLRLADLPGSYSLDPHSAEEDETLQFLLREPLAGVVVVCEPGCLTRNLLIAYQIAALPRKVPIILCVNLMDEAEKRGLSVDPEALEKATGFQVILTSAKNGTGLSELKAAMEKLVEANTAEQPFQNESDAESISIPPASSFLAKAAQVARDSLIHCAEQETRHKRRENRLEQLLTGRATAIPLAILLLALVFWLTIEGSNRPSAWLSAGFSALGRTISAWPFWSVLPAWMHGILIDGVYQTLSFVVAVMLPPMAIFFPLFTLMEDFGLLPRIAFNFDRCFCACNACGKQALTMCMGFGCNAVGVTGCRIIDSPRERMVAILTNALVPCNGKFPTLVALMSLFVLQARGGAGKYDSILASVLLTCLVVGAVLLTFPVSKILSATVLRGQTTGFALEMPPFRTPHVGRVLWHSLWDRTLFVLGRAVSVAAPAGAILWLMTHVLAGEQGCLLYLTRALDPIGALLCVDGAILVALILSAPANELTLPILLMIYTASDRLVEAGGIHVLSQQLTGAGWTGMTAAGFIVLFLYHAPCTTTLLTIRKETGKWRWALLAAGIPIAIGICLCAFLKLGQILF